MFEWLIDLLPSWLSAPIEVLQSCFDFISALISFIPMPFRAITLVFFPVWIGLIVWRASK